MKKRNIPIFITIGILILCVTFIVVLIVAHIYATVFWEHPHYGIFYIGNYYEGIGMEVDIDEENERVIVVTKNNDEYPAYYFEFSIIFNDDYKFYDEYVMNMLITIEIMILMIVAIGRILIEKCVKSLSIPMSLAM